MLSPLSYKFTSLSAVYIMLWISSPCNRKSPIISNSEMILWGLFLSRPLLYHKNCSVIGEPYWKYSFLWAFHKYLFYFRDTLLYLSLNCWCHPTKLKNFFFLFHHTHSFYFRVCWQSTILPLLFENFILALPPKIWSCFRLRARNYFN